MPSPDELKQALDEQRMVGLEKSRVEIIAKALKLSEQTVARVMYAERRLGEALESTILDERGYQQTPMLGLDVVSHELCDALTHAMKQGAHRLLLRHFIKYSKPLYVLTEDLLSYDRRDDLCNGCPERLPCIADSLHTPEDCYTGRKTLLQVHPVRVNKAHVEVEAVQPAGRYLIPFTKIQWRNYVSR